MHVLLLVSSQLILSAGYRGKNHVIAARNNCLQGMTYSTILFARYDIQQNIARYDVQQNIVCKVWRTAKHCLKSMTYSKTLFARYDVQQNIVCKVWRTAKYCLQGMTYSKTLFARYVQHNIGSNIVHKVQHNIIHIC